MRIQLAGLGAREPEPPQQLQRDDGAEVSVNLEPAELDALADTEHRTLISTIDKAVKRGALHRNTGARKKSRAVRVRAGEGS